MRVFVPVEDAPIGVPVEMLVPYHCGLSCEHGLRDVETYFRPSREAAALRSSEFAGRNADSSDSSAG